MEFVKRRWFAIALFLVAFTAFYGGTSLLPHYASLDWATDLDRAIPFVPVFIVFYFMADLIVMVPLLFIAKERIARYTAGLLVLLAVSAFMFVLLPVEMDKSVAYDDSAWSYLARLQHEYDTEFNNFPSLHVAFTLFATLALWRERKEWGYIASPLALCIIASVVLVKQHLLIDIAGGMLLAAAVYYWYANPVASRVERAVHTVLTKW